VAKVAIVTIIVKMRARTLMIIPLYGVRISHEAASAATAERILHEKRKKG